MENSKKNREEWKKELTPEEFHVMFEKGTEAPYSGEYYLSEDEGIYKCKACGSMLFKSDTKFDAGCGWPSFYEPIEKGSVEYRTDLSGGMIRTEVSCGHCGAHLGHVFDDAKDKPTGQRYCINSVALNFKDKE